MASVYILLNLDKNKTYTGSTDNLKKRLYEHETGKCKSTRNDKWELFYKEEYDILSEARKRERYLKTCSGRRFIKSLFK